MKPYLTKTPALIKDLYPKYIWDIQTGTKELYLTFDDGPHPEITTRVLDLLDQYQAKATFFCVGDNIRKYPETFQKILKAGHSTGNHTFNHLNGWTTRTDRYLANIEKTESIIDEQKAENLDSNFTAQNLPSAGGLKTTGLKLFRPPYGKIRQKQAKYLLSNIFKIIMWDVLSGDFDTRLSPEKCYNNIIESAQRGSIIVFHDSEKAFERLKVVLPKTLDFFSRKGYSFNAIM